MAVSTVEDIPMARPVVPPALLDLLRVTTLSEITPQRVQAWQAAIRDAYLIGVSGGADDVKVSGVAGEPE